MTGRRSHGRLSALNGVVHQGSARASLSPPPTGWSRISRRRCVSRIALRVGGRHAFLEEPIFEDELGHNVLQPAILLSEIRDFRGCRLAGGIANQPPLASFQKLLAPAFV